MSRNSLLTLLISCVACATAKPPSELLRARDSITQAEAGAAQKYKPDQVHEARGALEAAERSFKEHGASEETRTLAYVAERKAQVAEESGATQQLIEQRKQATAQREQAAVAALEQQRQREQAALAALERQRRTKPVEKRILFTLPGSVSFASGESSLLPPAQAQLDRVAETLKAQPDQRIVVEGYTDSSGGDAVNQPLSQRRADAVRSYLVSRGVSAEQVTSVGRGASDPIAANTTAEGRATNRRVQIVVSSGQPTPGTSATGTGSATEPTKPPPESRP